MKMNKLLIVFFFLLSSQCDGCCETLVSKILKYNTSQILTDYEKIAMTYAFYNESPETNNLKIMIGRLPDGSDENTFVYWNSYIPYYIEMYNSIFVKWQVISERPLKFKLVKNIDNPGYIISHKVEGENYDRLLYTFTDNMKYLNLRYSNGLPEFHKFKNINFISSRRFTAYFHGNVAIAPANQYPIAHRVKPCLNSCLVSTQTDLMRNSQLLVFDIIVE